MDNYKQNYMRGIVYESITRLLPVMGRDFKVNIKFIDDRNLTVRIEALTTLGIAIKGILLADLNETIKSIQKEKEEEYGSKQRHAETTVPLTVSADNAGTGN